MMFLKQIAEQASPEKVNMEKIMVKPSFRRKGKS